MWVAGITQGLMWREYGPDGYLVNSFAETVAALHELYIIRAVGGVMYLGGAVIMGYNIWMTIVGRLREEVPMGAMPHYDPDKDRPIARPITPEPAE